MAGLLPFDLDELARRMAEMNVHPDTISEAIGVKSPRLGDIAPPAMSKTPQGGRNAGGSSIFSDLTKPIPTNPSFPGARGGVQRVGDRVDSFLAQMLGLNPQGSGSAPVSPPDNQKPRLDIPSIGEPQQQPPLNMRADPTPTQLQHAAPDAAQTVQLSGLGDLLHPNMTGQDRPNVIAPNALPVTSASGLPQMPIGMARPGVVAPNTAQMLAPQADIGAMPAGTTAPAYDPSGLPPLDPNDPRAPQVRSTQTTPVTPPRGRAGELETRGIPGNIRALISSAATKYGQDPNTLLRIGYIESHGDPNARNKSGASGLFQFMPGTADDYGLTDPFDAAANADAAARLMRDNRIYLTQKLGREPTPGELYLAHQQGAGGAEALLANPDKRAADVLGKNGSAKVVQNGGNADMTAAQFANMWTSRIDNMGDVPEGPDTAISNAAQPGTEATAGADTTPTGTMPPAEKTFAEKLAEVSKGIKAPPASDRGKPPSGVAPLPQPGQLTPNPDAIKMILGMLGGAGGTVPQVAPTLGQLLGAGQR